MDVLKSAKRAIRSPGLGKQSWNAGKHQKLPENWTDTRETLLEGMTFNLRHLGMTLVDQPKGEDLSAAAVKRIIATTKASGRKPTKVALKVSPQGILLYNTVSNQVIESISIYRISYCTADKIHDKVFAYIAQNQHSETLECHAFLCAKRKVAQAVTLTVAQAFRVAFELWQLAREEKEQKLKPGCAVETHNDQSDAATGNLLDFSDFPNKVSENIDNQANHLNAHGESDNNNTVWEKDDGLDEAFSRFAKARSQVLDIGLSSLGCACDPDTDKVNANAPTADQPLRETSRAAPVW